MTTIGLVRHGVTDWNVQRRAQGQTDIPLNEDGRNQAAALAERLKGELWDVVVSSDLSRAYDTAYAVSSALDIPLVTDKRLREISFGRLEGMTEEERIDTWGTAWKELDHNIESNEEAQARSKACVEDICARFPEQRVLFVSHGATINQLIRVLLKDETFDQGFGNTAYTILVKEQNNWSCSLLNCTKHIEQLKVD
ncbi:histidine phosphatase family protein [Radiobacillus sp. PE A8.2]|uniref:histidine phosphatase family protein n=1 Tax=Radiobacillus sp. PE A8.2 TaxID=3380349 RepID=UPI00388F286E